MFEKLDIFMDQNLLVGECPTWDEQKQILYNVDIRGKCYYATDYSSGISQKITVPQMLGCMALCKDEDIILSMEDGVYLRNPQGDLQLAHSPVRIKGARFNDGKVGPDGAYYVGTADDGGSGGFYRLSGGVLTELFDRCACSNGLDWSSDGETLYYCDSRRQEIEAFAFSGKSHNVSDRRSIFQIPQRNGSPDGMAIDTEGNLWVAIWGGWCVLNIDPTTGEILKKIDLPVKQVSSCCFAGADMKDLIITTAAVRTSLDEQPQAGYTFVYRSDVPGVFANRYRK